MDLIGVLQEDCIAKYINLLITIQDNCPNLANLTLLRDTDVY